MNMQKTNYNFNGKNISAQAGGITIDNYLQKTGFEKFLCEKFDTHGEITERGPGAEQQYTDGQLCFQFIRGIMLGQKNPTEIARTILDPLNTVVSNVHIASQATFSRFFTCVNERKVEIISSIQKTLIKKYFATLVKKNGGKKLEKAEISDDSTKIETYGKQEGGEFISHYGVVGYHPDLITEDIMGLIMKGILRDGNVYSSTGSHLLLQEIIDLLKPFVQKIVFRGDSAYTRPEILDVLDTDGIEMEVYLKAKTYSGWVFNCNYEIEHNGILYHPLDLPKEYFEEFDEKGKKKLVERYFSFAHKANSWSKEETIVCRMRRDEKDGEGLFAMSNKDVEMIIVRNGEQGALAFGEYGKRGKQEKFLEIFKNDAFGKTLSHQKKIQNEFELYLKIIAYNLMQILRLETLHGTKYANCRIETLRNLLVRVGGKIVRHAREILVKLSKTFIYQKWFKIVMERIPIIQFSFY